MKAEKLNNSVMFQACYIETNGESKRCVKTFDFPATQDFCGQVSNAYAAKADIDGKPCAGEYLIYPLATLDDGESVYNLAEYVRRQFQKWSETNNNAIMSALMKKPDVKEDEKQTAALFIIQTLTENSQATMYDVYNAAYNALSRERDRMERKSERVYNPEWAQHNPFIDVHLIATFPKLARLVSMAIDKADLQEKQADVITMYMRGIYCKDALEHLKISKNAYYKGLYKGLYKILAAMIEIDGANVQTFTESGIDAESVYTELANYKARASRK